MIKYLGLKINTIPIHKGTYMLSTSLIYFYIFLMASILMSISYRIVSIKSILIHTEKFERKNLLADLKLIKKILIKLNDLFIETNQFFSSCLLMYFFIIFIFAVDLSFLAYDINVHKLGREDKILLACGTGFFVAASPCTVVMMIYSKMIENLTITAFKEFNLIHLKCDVKHIRKSCELAILQLQHCRISFSCGMFDIDTKLIFAICASSFTFLVTMIQFDFMISTSQLKF